MGVQLVYQRINAIHPSGLQFLFFRIASRRQCRFYIRQITTAEQFLRIAGLIAELEERIIDEYISLWLSAPQYILCTLSIVIDFSDILPERIGFAEHRREVHSQGTVIEWIPAFLRISIREVTVWSAMIDNLIHSTGQDLIDGHTQLFWSCEKHTIDIHRSFAGYDRTVIEVCSR